MKKIDEILADNLYTQHVRQAKVLSQLEQAVKQAISGAGGNGLYCRVLSCHDGELCLTTTNVVDAARLRQILPSVTCALSNKFPCVGRIRISIQP